MDEGEAMFDDAMVDAGSEGGFEDEVEMNDAQPLVLTDVQEPKASQDRGAHHHI